MRKTREDAKKPQKNLQNRKKVLAFMHRFW